MKVEHGDYIFLKEGTEAGLSYEEGVVDNEWIEDRSEPWVVDSDPNEEGMINISRLSDPYPGAFCSWVHVDDIERIQKTSKST